MHPQLIFLLSQLIIRIAYNRGAKKQLSAIEFAGDNLARNKSHGSYLAPRDRLDRAISRSNNYSRCSLPPLMCDKITWESRRVSWRQGLAYFSSCAFIILSRLSRFINFPTRDSIDVNPANLRIKKTSSRWTPLYLKHYSRYFITEASYLHAR